MQRTKEVLVSDVIPNTKIQSISKGLRKRKKIGMKISSYIISTFRVTHLSRFSVFQDNNILILSVTNVVREQIRFFFYNWPMCMCFIWILEVVQSWYEICIIKKNKMCIHKIGQEVKVVVETAADLKYK